MDAKIIHLANNNFVKCLNALNSAFFTANYIVCKSGILEEQLLLHLTPNLVSFLYKLAE